MEKQTNNQLLTKILAEVKEINKKMGSIELETTQIQDDFITITDNGKLKTSEILKKCREKFKVWSYFSDDKLDEQFPPPKKPTSRKFKFEQEASDYPNKSYNDLKEMGITKQCITLRERLLFESEYFKKEGKHLDVDNRTFCAGSRYSGGNVPRVDWNSYYDGMFVDWCRPESAGDVLRSRSAV